MNKEIEQKLKGYIKQNIDEDDIIFWIYIDKSENYISFPYHWTISLNQLKDIANILNVENIFITSETEKYDGDHETIIEW